MSNCSRRNFLKTGFAAGLLAGTGSLPLRAARGTATDWVTLGKSGVKVTRLAFGTGTFSGRTQRELGQETSPVWYATPTIAAFASSRLPSLTARCTRCWASR